MTFTFRRLSAGLLLGTLGIAAATGTASAGTQTTTFQVTAQVESSCSVAATNMSFGVYSLGTGNTANSTITVTCTNGVNAQISLDPGQNGGKAGTYGSRAMTAGGNNYLGYEIYTSPALTTVWNTNNIQTVVSGGSPVTLTAYGKLPAAQGVTTGTYSDCVTITATY